MSRSQLVLFCGIRNGQGFVSWKAEAAELSFGDPLGGPAVQTCFVHDGEMSGATAPSVLPSVDAEALLAALPLSPFPRSLQ
jgi:hypothetical protein